MSLSILYTSTSYPPALGGAQLHTHQIVKRLAERHRTQVLAFWKTNRTDWLLGTTLRAPTVAESYVLDGVPVQGLTIPKSAHLPLLPYVAGYYGIRPLAIRQISKYILPQIDEHAKAVSATGGVIHGCRIGREPISFASLQAARKHNVPFIFVPYHHPRWVGWKYRDYLSIYREADGVLALTQKEKEILTTLGVREERIFVTGIGPIVDESADATRFRTSHSIPAGVPLILFLGQKYQYKGVDALAQAAKVTWQKWPDAHFAFVGPRTDFSRKVFASFADKRLVEIGGVDLAEKSEALAACTLLCLPSSQESFGGVFTEAWSFAKPVIGADIPASREVIAHGVDGLLCEPEASQIAEQIHQLLADPARAQAMGEAGRQKVVERFQWDHLAQLTEQAYLKVMHGQGL